MSNNTQPVLKVISRPSKAFNSRCTKSVQGSTGTGYFKGQIYRCGRVAKYSVDGKKFCAQHAGAYLLDYNLSKLNHDR